jgi:hypothetical protein
MARADGSSRPTPVGGPHPLLLYVGSRFFWGFLGCVPGGVLPCCRVRWWRVCCGACEVRGCLARVFGSNRAAARAVAPPSRCHTGIPDRVDVRLDIVFVARCCHPFPPCE